MDATGDVRATAESIVDDDAHPDPENPYRNSPGAVKLAAAWLMLTDPAPVNHAFLVAEPGWAWCPDADCYERRIPAGAVLLAWPDGKVDVSRGGHLIRLVEAGCTVGRLRGLVRALDSGVK